MSLKEDHSSSKPVNLHVSSSVMSVKKEANKLIYSGVDQGEVFASTNALPSKSVYYGAQDHLKDPLTPARDFRASDSKGKAFESPSVASRHRHDGLEAREPRTPLRGTPIRKRASRTVLISGVQASDSHADIANIPGVEMPKSNSPDMKSRPTASKGLLKWGKGKAKEDTDGLLAAPQPRKRILSEHMEESPSGSIRFQEQRKRYTSMMKISPFNPDMSGISSPGIKIPPNLSRCRVGTFDNLDSPGLPNLRNSCGRGQSLKQSKPGIMKESKQTNFLIPEDLSDDSEDSKKAGESLTNLQKEQKSLKFCSSIVRKVSMKQMAEIPEEVLQSDQLRKVESKNESNAQKTEETRDAINARLALKTSLNVNQSNTPKQQLK